MLPSKFESELCEVFLSTRLQFVLKHFCIHCLNSYLLFITVKNIADALNLNLLMYEMV